MSPPDYVHSLDVEIVFAAVALRLSASHAVRTRIAAWHQVRNQAAALQVAVAQASQLVRL
jgi:hypothetical protein